MSVSVGSGSGRRPGHGGSLSIVVGEDDVHLRSMFAQALRGAGFGVVEAGSGEEVLDALKHGALLVVLDIVLPAVDGLEVLARIRGSHDVPVIMVTGRGEEVDRVVGLEMGADRRRPPSHRHQPPARPRQPHGMSRVATSGLGDADRDLRRCDGDPDTRLRDFDLADARARITEAIETAATTYPPFETQTTAGSPSTRRRSGSPGRRDRRR
ncbi:MAG: response regulator [Nitriliruptorales bacterium]